MSDCAHSKSKLATIKREFLGETFSAEGKICADCGAELWDNLLDAKYKTWIDGLDKRPKIQFKVSKEASQCLNRLHQKFPGASQATLLRSMIMAYLNLLSLGDEVSVFLNQVFETEVFIKLQNAEKTESVATVVKPSFFHDVSSWGNLFEMSYNEMSSEAFHSILAICFTSDAKLQEFWKTEILPRLETYLKIA